MILAALEIEVEEYRQQHRNARDPRGHALVVRNGQARLRRVTVGAGTITNAAPRVNDQRVLNGTRQKFTTVLPLLYLHGLSTRDFREVLPVLLGADAAGLSPTALDNISGKPCHQAMAGTNRCTMIQYRPNEVRIECRCRSVLGRRDAS